MNQGKNWPDVLAFENGQALSSPAEWEARAAELRSLYERTMYGTWRTGEQVSWSLSDEGAVMISFFGTIPAEGAKNLTLTISNNGRTASWSLPVFLPDRETVANLFMMTPFYYRTDARGRERLGACDSLAVTASVEYSLFEV